MQRFWLSCILVSGCVSGSGEFAVDDIRAADSVTLEIERLPADSQIEAGQSVLLLRCRELEDGRQIPQMGLLLGSRLQSAAPAVRNEIIAAANQTLRRNAVQLAERETAAAVAEASGASTLRTLFRFGGLLTLAVSMVTISGGGDPDPCMIALARTLLHLTKTIPVSDVNLLLETVRQERSNRYSGGGCTPESIDWLQASGFADFGTAPCTYESRRFTRFIRRLDSSCRIGEEVRHDAAVACYSRGVIPATADALANYRAPRAAAFDLQGCSQLRVLESSFPTGTAATRVSARYGWSCLVDQFPGVGKMQAPEAHAEVAAQSHGLYDVNASMMR